MNFTAYIERQKNLIRSRHEGETFLSQNGEITLVSETERLFSEIKATICRSDDIWHFI